MSIWTHVTGCVRVDTLPFLHSEPVENIVMRAFGQTCTYDDDPDTWDECTAPCGSEGSLEYRVVRTGSDNSLSWGLVYIWGDLRDYSDVDNIVSWLQNAEKVLSFSGIGIRGLSVCVEVEYSGQYHLEIDDDGKIGAIRSGGAEGAVE